MSLQPDDEQELFDDLAAAARVLAEAMNTKKTTKIGDLRQLTIRAYSILKPWLRKESA